MKIIEKRKWEGIDFYVVNDNENIFDYVIGYSSNYTRINETFINCIIKMNENNPQETIEKFERLLLLK
jgi:hypothetical protein